MTKTENTLFHNGSPGPHGDLFGDLGPLLKFWVPFLGLLFPYVAWKSTSYMVMMFSGVIKEGLGYSGLQDFGSENDN